MRNIFLCLCVIFISRNIFSQEVEKIVALGDSFYYYQRFDIAANEYQRAFFFSDQDRKALLAEKIANCFLASGKYGSARNFYDTVIIYSQTDSLRIEAEFRKILSYMLEDNFGYALLKLNLLTFESNHYFQQKLIFYKGICYFGLKDYSLAFEYFDNSIPPDDSIKHIRLHQLYKNRKMLNRPNPLLAACLSVVIPGSGQTYSGDLADGLNSALLLGSLTYIGLYTSPVNVFIVTPLFFRYYMGGIKHAKEDAENKRNQRNFYFYNCLMDIIIKK
jgi:tetratricopeptide (TPR) repeat protein